MTFIYCVDLKDTLFLIHVAPFDDFYIRIRA